MQIRAHSPRTFSSPRKRNCRNPRACFVLPQLELEKAFFR